MRKTMRIAGIFLAIMMLFTLTGCTPKTAEKGKEKMEKKGEAMMMQNKNVIQVYSEKEGKMVDVEVIGKDERKVPTPVMLVVEEEE